MMKQENPRYAVCSWRLPPAALTLKADEVHVWRTALDRDPSTIERLEQTLSADERARAARFYFKSHCQRFIAARGLLRFILGRYLGVEPGDLSFMYGPYGKPALAGRFATEGLCFNVSHSEGLGLYAVARGRDVGIDVEYRRGDFPGRDVAQRFFSYGEIEALCALPKDLQAQGFFNCWTRKEAYIKATGRGLSLPLDQFDVALVPGEPAALLHTRPDAAESCRWRLQELTLGADYTAALAVAGSGWLLRCWEIPDEFPGLGEPPTLVG